MDRPTLAIAIPAYNEAALLPRLLTAVRNQTVPFDEVLVYDDCSTDDTAQIAERFGATVVRGQSNVGCSGGKNALAGHSRCDWIHFLDADDIPLPEFVERAHTWMRQPDAPDVVLFNYDYRDLLTDELIIEMRFDGAAVRADPIAYAIRTNITNIGVYRRDRFLSVGGFDLEPAVRYNEDAAMHIRLAVNGLTFDREPALSIIMYRRQQSMSTANSLKCVRAQYRVMEKTAERVGSTHGGVIADRLWKIAGVAAAALDWDTTDAAIALATRLGGRRPKEGGPVFRSLCTISPHWAVRVRERMIRWLKPHLRTGQP